VFPFFLLILFLQVVTNICPRVDAIEPSLRADLLHQEIMLDPWGNLFYFLTYDLSNSEGSIIYFFDLQVPKDAEDVTVYDPIGTLIFELSEGDHVQFLLIYLRYPLRGVINSVVYNDACSFTVKYRVNAQTMVTPLDASNQFQLRTPVSTSHNWTIPEYVVSITLPEGAKMLQTTPPNAEVSQKGFTESLVFTFQNVTSSSEYIASVEYDYLVLWSAFRPVLWIGLPVLLLGGIILLRKRSKPASPIRISKNVEILQSFADTYDRRLMIRSELNSLEELLDEKRIGKKDYNRRKRILTQQVQVLNKAIKKLAQSVRQEGVQYKTIIERLERNEQELTKLTSEIKRLRTQFRLRKISKKTYRTTRRNYDRRFERVTVEMEGILIELKEESR
jgi:hypothetical protein